MIRTRNMVNSAVTAKKLNKYLREGRHLWAKIADQPAVFQVSSSLMAFPTAAQGQSDYVHGFGGSRNPYYMELYQTTAQTLMPLLDGTKGLEIALDQVNNESVEYVPGGNNARNPLSMVVGTDPDFFLRAKILIDDASGLDQMLIGWRKQEAFAVPTSFLTTGDGVYTDFFGVGFAATVANPNVVRTSSDLNNGGSATVTSTGFTWADGLVHELEVRVIGGTVQVYINGIKIGSGVEIAVDGDGAAISSQSTSAVASFTFDSGDRLVPFLFLRQDADLSPVYLRELEIGHLMNRGLDPNGEDVSDAA